MNYQKNSYQIPTDQESVHLVIPARVSTILTHEIVRINQTITIHVQDHADVKIQLQDEPQSIGSTILHIFVQQHAQVTCLLGLMQSSSVNLEIHLYLQGAYAQADVFGLYALNQDQKVIIKTFQMHHGPNTQSNVELKGMLKDHAQADVQGLIYIDGQARKADASQENKNIVFGKNARVVSIPSIEVLQHDVQCCHGTAIGQFDAKHLWYLQSRGLSGMQAHQLLVTSFFGQVMQKFENKEKFMEMVCQKMI